MINAVTVTVCVAAGLAKVYDNDSPRLLLLNQSPPSLTVPFSLSELMTEEQNPNDDPTDTC